MPEFEILVLDKKDSIEQRLHEITNALRLNLDVTKYYFDPTISYTTNTGFKGKKGIIEIGHGCTRSCQFCMTSNSTCGYRDIEQIKKEILYFLESGYTNLYIPNHNSTNNLQILHEICDFLIEKINDYNFIWSCALIPEQLNNDKEIFQKLKSSRCEVVELLVYSINKTELHDFNLSHSKDEIKKVVSELNNAGITLTIIELLIITELIHSEKYQNELIDFSSSIIEIAPGMIEFRLFTLDKITDAIENYDFEFSETPPEPRRVHEVTLKNKFFSRILKKTYENIFKMKREHRLAHCELYSKGYASQHFIYFLSKSSTFILYSMIRGNIFLKFSNEIKNEILDYSPCCYVLPIYRRNQILLGVDPMLLENKSEILLELKPLEEQLYHSSREYKKIAEIIDLIHLEFDLSKEEAKSQVIDFYKKLESLDLLYFTKTF